jgi:VWFA-related protein
MKSNSFAIGCGLTLAACALLTSSQEPSRNKEFTISTTSRLVLLDVSVRGPGGASVSGLSKENFQVFEDGKRQEVTQFSNVDSPVTVGILVDESGSMRFKKAEVITAALGFVTFSNPHDEMFVLSFNEKVRRGLPDTMLFSDDAQLLRSALLRTAPEGRTALYDAILAGLRQLNMGREDKKTLILISDGGDNVSSSTLKDVMNSVLQSEATIYTIGVFSPDDPDRNPGVLKRLAEVSGGEAYFPPKLEEIVPICRRIAADVRARYTIGYVPSGEGGHKIRHIRVAVNSPERAKLTARTRTSYLMNEQGSADRERP